MKAENKAAAYAAGVFLILYTLPYSFGTLLDLSSGKLREGLNFLSLAEALLVPLVGLFLILRKPKIAAILMTASVLAVFISILPQLPEYFKVEGGMISVEISGDYIVHMPAFLGLTPLLMLLSVLLFAVMLFFRGPALLVLAILAVLFMVASTLFQFQMLYYLPGHPTLIHFSNPFNFVMAAIFASRWLLSVDS